MKNIIIAFLFITIFIGKTNAQIPIYKQPYKPLKGFKGDIKQYFLYNIIDFKDNFISKKVSIVLDMLEANAITYLPDLSGSLTVGLSLYFNDMDTTIMREAGREQKELNLHISFTTAIPWESMIRCIKKTKNNGRLTKNNSMARAS